MNDPFPSSAPPIIDIRRLTRQFGNKTALDDVSLVVPRGGVFGLIGGNGAGKTTLIKHILGMLKPQAGRCRSSVSTRCRTRSAPWAASATSRKTAIFPTGCGWANCFGTRRRSFPRGRSLCRRIAAGVRPRQQGADQDIVAGPAGRAGLLVALAYRPELLVLDEPSSGLDPVVRRDILRAIIRTIADEGRTVFFSSHLLDEVERVADRVAMIHQGQIVLIVDG